VNCTYIIPGLFQIKLSSTLYKSSMGHAIAVIHNQVNLEESLELMRTCTLQTLRRWN